MKWCLTVGDESWWRRVSATPGTGAARSDVIYQYQSARRLTHLSALTSWPGEAGSSQPSLHWPAKRG
jgi:hypothetical protein